MHGSVHPLTEVLDDHYCGRAEVEGNIILSDDTTALESIDYIGDIIIISTAGGKQLSVTPHHPVLTDRGWIAAAFIHEGDNVISANIGNGTPVKISPDKYNIPTCIENIPIANRMVFTSMPKTAKYFNRDGGHGKFDAIYIDRLLWDGLNASQRKHIKQFALNTRHSGSFFSSDCGFNQSFNIDWFSLKRILSIFNDSSFLFGCHRFIPKRIGLGKRYSGNIISNKNIMDDTPADFKRFGNCIFGFSTGISQNNFAFRKPSDFEPSLFGDFPALNFHTFGFSPKQSLSLEIIRKCLLASMPTFSSDFRTITSEVIFDRVVKVNTRYFSGHVYSLQTQKEWYYSNGIVSHNCAMLPYIKGVDYGLENGEEHFKGLPESTQIELMGRGKWEAYKAGKFQFSQLSKIYDDIVYGQMRGETPLKDLVNEQ
jgi:hypothetical protein